MKIIENLCSSVFICGLILTFAFAVLAQNQPPTSARILLLPLDDRPPCLQFPIKMGLIADAEIVTPPRELLGRFTEPGKSDEIIKWLKTQNFKSFDAAIVSVDMLAYGGLVAMRIHETDDKTAMRRIQFVREMRKLAPEMKIYGSSVIMRLAPTGDVKNEAYREKLAQWAEISVDATRKTEIARLEADIPAPALADYQAARTRDLKINQASIALVKDKIFDYLILSQDDAKPKGIHIADREKLIEQTKNLGLTEKIAVQPGADEVSMLLLARAISTKYNYHPKIKAVYSSVEASNRIMPYEDRPLRQTASFHIKAVGGIEVPDKKDADLLFYVYASRFEPNRGKSFADEIAGQIAQGKKVVVADIDPKGDVQGAEDTFIQELLRHKTFSLIAGFAGWNTAGNTIGTTLPQGIIATVNLPEKNQTKTVKIKESQSWYLMHRLIDDYAYHSIVRPQALKMIRANKWNSFRLSDVQTKEIEAFCLSKLKPVAATIAREFNSNERKACSVEDLTFKLSWNRTFEAEINFKVKCSK